MQTITTVTNVYSFEELNEEAQQKAIEKLYDINVSYDWWESTYEDAANVFIKITGFDIDRGAYCNGEFTDSATQTANKILTEHGEECSTYKTAHNFLANYKELVAKYSDGIDTDEVEEGNEYEFDQEADEMEEDFLKSILEDYRIILRDEYDYQTSEEAIKETIEENDYQFTEDGKQF